MRQVLRVCATALAIFGSLGMAAAQQSPAQSGGQDKLNLNQAQGHAVMQGLRNEQTQQQPSGPHPQVGSKVPESTTPKAMPNDVTAQVPETKNFLFVKLPDRVLVIDPDTRIVAEIILASETTGSGPGTSSSPQR